MKNGKFTVTFIQSSMGHRDEGYIRSWQMEPLSIGVLAGLTPKDVEIKFYDDRMEKIPYDEPTDLVAIAIESYTAKRSYQIATEYRKRKVPVVMGGYHATLVWEEVAEYAESVVVGEAEGVWGKVIDDYRHNTPQKIYRSLQRPSLENVVTDRTIFRGKKYLPIRLVEFGRGCPFSCEFCCITSFYGASYRYRSIGSMVREFTELKPGSPLFFLVDDNIVGNRATAMEFFQAIAPLKIRWISQVSIQVGEDEALLEVMKRSGCEGVLIGFESLDPGNLAQMDKQVNLAHLDFGRMVRAFHRHRIRIYGTFVFGYDHDTPDTFSQALRFAQKNGFYMAAFNHLMAMPGTRLYTRLQEEGRLLYEKWWLDETYSFNQPVFAPRLMSPKEIRKHCLSARRKFYSPSGILKRWFHPVNRSDFFMFRLFLPINALHGIEVMKRDGFPMGDVHWKGPLLKAL